MQGGAYIYVNRLGSYHKNLSLDTFFKIKVINIEEAKSQSPGKSSNDDAA